METRDITVNDQVVGSLSFPDGTSEDVWAAALAAYTPSAAADRISKRILAAMDVGKQMIADYGALNVLAGYDSTQIATIATALAPLQALLLSGSLKTALAWLEAFTPTDLITQDTINVFADRIRNFLNS